MVVLSREALHESVVDPVSASMNFLNEVAGRYPEAISLAAGRPFDEFHSVADIDKHIQAYLTHLRERGLSGAAARQLLTQYGRTNGHVGDLIARMLDVDENIQVPAAAVMVTTGCQEAMVIALRGLCAGPGDVVLAAEPCYVGLTGAARILGVEVVGVPESPDGLRPETVRAVAAAVRARGKTPKALYLVPNFANPSGVSLPVPVRRALLAAAADEDLLILEDDPYGLFGLDDEPRPTLKSLDSDQRVIYLGSFAKSYFPGARVGYLVADQTVADAAGRRTLLAEELSTVKSMLTVNTSALSQAVVGGMLIDSGFSLRAVNQAKIAFYRRNLNTLLASLHKHFAGTAVRWNNPSGGFFVVCDVPVDASEALLEVSAQEYGVLWTPMRFFYVGGGGTHAIRLSCSAIEPDRIEEGVGRLAALLRR
ncbi:PLP-dependent aminotransferase family protein [Dactylosporangium vinaceum]|uniref:PLP-dependent aminotransferase family protein n=1 Tax=Dactylosporangium vinaceum TaxID=53362 RepID=A0ABV5MGE1_9ACTN|nr:PLP-dependent aminotransferase family protein [Dactylosporangium vinaceum]UAC01651.1 PLP-dependent aminotransferase family protein [Dactylosporangium vinaceum]